ncbi:MAG: transglutaminase domain-containing protein [Planctomycetia bacterium]|nr:transglutaminase domain-containing protein [Planctomycetia bacterium]
MRSLFGILLLLLACFVAQAEERADPNDPQLGQPLTQRYRLGCVVKAAAGPCKGVVVNMPVPMDWPEQRVKVISEEKSKYVGNVKYAVLEGGVKQLQLDVPNLPAGAEASVILIVEVTRHPLEPPKETAGLSLPARPSRDVAAYLTESPYIESKNAKIAATAKEIVAGKESAWEKVETIYDWVRDHVEYEERDKQKLAIQGALEAMRRGKGDCEDMTSLFIALCRANKIPARTVWVPGHCYPEFYLVDGEGKGHWFPCQAAGDRAFGGIPETRFVLQKGDNFKDPNKPRERVRYMEVSVKGVGAQKPSIEVIREPVVEEK